MRIFLKACSLILNLDFFFFFFFLGITFGKFPVGSVPGQTQDGVGAAGQL